MAGLLAMAAAAPRAHADSPKLEIGGFGGFHIFSHDNEIGVPDLPGGVGPNGEVLPDALSPANSPVIGFRLGYALNPTFTLEGEAAFIPAKVRDSVAELLGLAYRAHAIVHLSGAQHRLRPFALFGAGGLSVSSSEPNIISSDSDFALHGGAGFKYAIGDSWGIRGDLRLILPPSSANESLTQDWEANIGLYGVYPRGKRVTVPKDSDGDGIVDEQDQCPNDAEDLDGFEDEDGCPDLDNDGDGLADTDDKCPNDAEDLDGFQDADGCPDLDNDGDGIPDAQDQCPNDAEDLDGFQDADGCPDPDNDGDGLADAQDQCPNDAEDLDGFQDADGCPDPDNDGDGVLDAFDQCPTELETWNGFQDDDGCPDELPRRVQRYTGVIQGITFETNKAVIRPSSFTVLNDAVKVLNEYPTLRVEISGHTDNTGDADYNRDLSRQRAEAVMQYFVGKGIDAGRLEAKGYGPDQPIADNAKAPGRAKNRRVEFKLLSQGPAATGEAQ